ncbi:ABC transporter ATP-binding protein [Gammaproteobacteria bacterium]|nr:ABC transporter ATP-binding protein [Gammaproteobacteria bacterium]
MQQEMIRMNNVCFGFTEQPLIHDFSMIAKKGDWITLMGPSGSGKTTLLHLIAGVLTPDSGEVLACAQVISTLSSEQKEKLRRQNFAMVFQDIRLLPMWNVLENVWMILHLQGWSKNKAVSMAHEWLEKVGIASLAHRSIDTLSGGQKQRVAIARAMAKSPAILLADEPTGGLDQKNTELMLTLMKDLCQYSGTTLVCVTHDDAVKSVSDHIIMASEWHAS